MEHELITSARKRRARALQIQLDAAVGRIATTSASEFSALLKEIESLREGLEATRGEKDEMLCFLCGTSVDPDDPLSGGIHFSRMSRHNGEDRVTAARTAELNLCPDCYSKTHERLLALSVEWHIERSRDEAASVADLNNLSK